MLANIALWVNERKSWWKFFLTSAAKEGGKLKSPPCEDESIALSINKKLQWIFLVFFSAPSACSLSCPHHLIPQPKREKNTLQQWEWLKQQHFPIHSFSALGRKFWAVFPYKHTSCSTLSAEWKKSSSSKARESRHHHGRNWRQKSSPHFHSPYSSSSLLCSAVVLCRLLILLTFFLCRRFS